jgi:hypothetical protein
MQIDPTYITTHTSRVYLETVNGGGKVTHMTLGRTVSKQPVKTGKSGSNRYK